MAERKVEDFVEFIQNLNNEENLSHEERRVIIRTNLRPFFDEFLDTYPEVVRIRWRLESAIVYYNTPPPRRPEVQAAGNEFQTMLNEFDRDLKKEILGEEGVFDIDRSNKED